MSEAMRLIVNGYVKLRARKELDDHRRAAHALFRHSLERLHHHHVAV
jgi:hypothetical protein